MNGLKKQTYKPNLLEALLRQIKKIQWKVAELFHRDGDDPFQHRTHYPGDMRRLERKTSQRANSVFFGRSLSVLLPFLSPSPPPHLFRFGTEEPDLFPCANRGNRVQRRLL